MNSDRAVGRSFRAAIIACLVGAVLFVGGCASRGPYDGPLLPSDVTSLSIDCNVLPLFAEDVFNAVWNLQICQELQAQMKTFVRAEGLSRSTPIAVTVALGSAYVFQARSTRPMKETAWRSRNYAALVDGLPLLLTPRFQDSFARVEAAYVTNLAQPGTPLFDNELPAVLWAETFTPKRRKAHLHLSLAGYYDPPRGAVQNLKMDVSLRGGDGCERADGTWLFDFSPEALRTAEQVTDLILERMASTLQAAAADYETWRRYRRKTKRC